jgi:hypothetical protein
MENYYNLFFEAVEFYELAETMVDEVRKLEQKGNRSAGKRARAALLEMRDRYQPLRDEILKRMKELPVKPRKK